MMFQQNNIPNMMMNNNYPINFPQNLGNDINSQMFNYQMMQQNFHNFNGLSGLNENHNMFVNPSNINLNIDLANKMETQNFNNYDMARNFNLLQQQQLKK